MRHRFPHTGRYGLAAFGEATMEWVLQTILHSSVRQGALRLRTPSGRMVEFGDGTGSPVAVRITSAKTQWAIILDPEMATGEAYMDGTLVVEQGSLADFLQLALSQDHSG